MVMSSTILLTIYETANGDVINFRGEGIITNTKSQCLKNGAFIQNQKAHVLHIKCILLVKAIF